MRKLEHPYKQKQINGRKIDEHRYIMEAHLGRKLERNEFVHHINHNKRDNRIENLTIMTPEEHNKLHLSKHPITKICIICDKEFEPHKTKRARNKVCSNECKLKLDKINGINKKKKIAQYTKDGKFLKTWDSATDIERELGYFGSNINKCVKGIIPSAYGFKWEYLNFKEMME